MLNQQTDKPWGDRSKETKITSQDTDADYRSTTNRVKEER